MEPSADTSPAHVPNLPERVVEGAIYASRWLLAPIYLGLAGALLILALKFFQELGLAFTEVWELDASDTVLLVLEFIDIALVGGLIVMVMLSGFENFVSRLDIEGDKLGWLGKLDAGSLKQKVAGSIVAISSIHLLRVFMHVERLPGEQVQWMVVLHTTFVMSALGVVAMDRFGRHH